MEMDHCQQTEVDQQQLTIPPEENNDDNKPEDSALTCRQHETAASLIPEELKEEEQAEGKTSREMEKEEGFQTSLRNFFRKFRLRDIKLIRAARAGNHAGVEELILGDHADPNTRQVDFLQWTPLMWASDKGHTETVKVLLKHKADPNIEASNGYAAVILASAWGHHEVVAALLDPSNPIPTDPNIRNSTRGWSALMWACQTYRIAGQSKSEEGKSNRRKAVQHLLAAGADVNLEAKNGWTPIMQASQDGDAELVKILCETPGVNINHQSKSSWSALTTACRRKHEDIAKVLVEHGANVNQKKKGGVTAMHIASYYNMKEAMKCMVRVGGEGVNIQDDWGMTPLILAAKQDHADLVQYFVTNTEADLNIQAEKYAKWSALFFVIKNGNQRTADFLVNHGADPRLLDKDHKEGNQKELTTLAYTKIELKWKATQLLNLILNV